MTRGTMALSVFLLALAATDATFDFSFWGRLKMDCGVSAWSEWEPTDGLGFRTHTRTVFRPPQNGGAPCPPLTETHRDPWFQTDVEIIAHQVNSMLISDIAFEGDVYRFKRQSQVIKPRDFLFILDMSGSISGDTYSMAKDNIAKLIGKICGTIGPGPADNRAAVITYSTNPVINFDFKEYLDLADLQAAVRNLPKVSSTTCTGKALNLGQQIFNLNRGLREKGISNKDVVLLTDGKTNCGPNAVEAAFDLKRSRYNPLVFVFAIGQYNDDDKLEMEKMASPPTSYHIFHLNNFTEFQQLVNFTYSIPLSCAPINRG